MKGFTLWVVFLTTTLSCKGNKEPEEISDSLTGESSKDILKREMPVNIGPEKRSTNTFVCRCYKRNCKELYDAGYKVNGVYRIDPDGKGSFLVYCDMVTSGGGWTVFQRRLDGTVDFYRNWNAYKDGFGNIYSEHWLGLERLRRMTSQQSYKLRVDLMDANGNWKYAEYSYFAVSAETLNYKLNLGSYSGNAGDSLRHHDNKMFSTKDKDNDEYRLHCAVLYSGAWWYGACHDSNLNGKYLGPGSVSSYANGIVWDRWKGDYYSMKRAEMKIRPL